MATATVIGSPISRIDGRKKVTGTAQYAAEFLLNGLTHAVLVDSPIASGHIKRIKIANAESAPGVLLVLTHENRGSLGKMPSGFGPSGTTAEDRPPLEDERIWYAGQCIAAVVAETLEQARYAASLIEVDYEPTPFAVALDDARQTTYKPEQFFGEALQLSRGNVAKALAEAEVTLDETYTTPTEHSCALEPHAAIASWSSGALTIYNSTQWIAGDNGVLAAAFGIAAENVHVRCPFTGGMFGSKAATHAYVILAALASKRLGRPVRAVLTRPQVLFGVGHRSETVQRIELGALTDGRITALRHQTTSHTSENEEFSEPTSIASRMLYAVPNYEASHDLVRLNVMKPGWMRAPGEAPCQFALESALDELSYQLKIDPVELRRRNHAAVNLNTGKPFSTKNLLACYDRGAERFGWNNRSPQPRSLSKGRNLIGWGMATSTYPGYLMGSTAHIRLENTEAGVSAVVSTAGTDTGTGMYTMMAIAAAEGLGLPVERVRVELGDSRLVSCAVAGGSNLTASTAPAIMDAAAQIRQQLLEIASRTADGFTGADHHIEEFIFQNGRLAHRAEPKQSISFSDLLSLDRRDSIQAQASTNPILGHNENYSFQSFGAHFVEAHVDERIGRVRVARIVSVFDCGRIVSAKTARSQFIGGIVFGIGQALFEELVYDREHGQAANADLAGYLVPTHADVPDIDVTWIDEPDYNFNSLGCRGIGEIGITGVAPAIANAVFHATGIRVRDLPITPDRLLGQRGS
jgi:xanthine dehydrogenase YagR molybdenum-binding subunit